MTSRALREVSTDERDKLAGQGKAMPDGSFPIAGDGDLRNAIQSYGRAKDPAAVKRHIVKRARALGRTDLLPESWKMSMIDLGALIALSGMQQFAQTAHGKDGRFIPGSAGGTGDGKKTGTMAQAMDRAKRDYPLGSMVTVDALPGKPRRKVVGHAANTADTETARSRNPNGKWVPAVIVQDPSNAKGIKVRWEQGQFSKA